MTDESEVFATRMLVLFTEFTGDERAGLDMCGGFMVGLRVALAHPEWAQAATRIIPRPENANEDKFVELLPVEATA